MNKVINNIMSVDLEEYYCDLPFPMWKNYEGNITNSIQKILELFKKYRVEATFFTLGYIAEKYPELIEKIKSDGHEIASHGYYHENIHKMDKNNFEKDVIDSINMISKVSGEKVLGYRAPYHSINYKNKWALGILSKYFTYDSSIFPVEFHYKNSSFPTGIYRMSKNDPILIDENSPFTEIPMATLKLPFIGNMPIAGGFYLRFLPLSIVKYGITKINKSENNAMCYIHAEDLNPNRIRFAQYSWHYYWGLKNATKKFENILKTFKFKSARSILNI